MTDQITRNGIKLNRDIGYVYDLLFVFAAHFNLDRIADQVNDDTYASREEYIDFIRGEVEPYFGDIDDDLYVFFHMTEIGRILLSCGFFKLSHMTDMNLERFIELVSDKDAMLLEFTKYYFHELDKNVALEASKSKEKLFELIKASKYTSEEKTKLYEFVFDPDRYIDLLVRSFREKGALLEKYYEEHYGEAIKLFSEIDLDDLPQNLLECLNEKGTDAKDDTTITKTIAICIINRDVICYFWDSEKAFIILGLHYDKVMERLKKEKPIDITAFGDVICEPSRVGILNYMLEKGEVICKELEKAFHFSGTTAYHHLTMMVKVGIVKTRVDKKTVIYFLNRKYVNKVLTELIKYSDLGNVNEIK